jgi:uncharacterized membrane protein YphA (DoxX/SURF4 family)
MAGLAETGGGLLLLALGLVTPVAAALVFGVMLVAAVTVQVKEGFLAQTIPHISRSEYDRKSGYKAGTGDAEMQRRCTSTVHFVIAVGMGSGASL